MPQYTFTSTAEFIEGEIEYLCKKESRSRSEMIDILLRYAVKERYRKRKKVHIQDNPANFRQVNAGR
jgi:hypothetical protein